MDIDAIFRQVLPPDLAARLCRDDPPKPGSRLYAYRGQRLTLAQLANGDRRKRERIRARLNLGWSVAEAVEITEPSPRSRRKRFGQ